MRLKNKICALTCAFLLALTSFAASVRPAYAVPTQDDLDAARAQLEQLGAEMASIQESLQKAECDLEETRNRIDETNAAIADTEAATKLPNGELFSAELRDGIYARGHLKGKT